MQAVEVETALDELRKAASAGNRDKKSHGIISRIAEYLVLLKSPSPPAQYLAKLSLALRKPLLPLYSAFPRQTLHLSRAVLTTIFEDKISSKSTDSGILGQVSLWETVQTEILSGILDFLETDETLKAKELVASALYPKLCEFYLPSSVTMKSYAPNVLLQTTAYTLLHETAASSHANQQRLRDPEVLGSKRLGLTLARTTEYLALEALLTLFARLLPSDTGKSASGRTKRIAFIRDVARIMSDQGIASVENIAKVLDFTPSTPWEETSVKIIEIFSNHISFPQPFHVDSICVGDITFPQPLPEDRLYVDKNGFLANVHQGNMYETFQALYSQVTSVKLSPDTSLRQKGVVMVTVFLSSLPLVGNLPLVCSDRHFPSITFQLQPGDTERFVRALHARDLGRRITQNLKMSKADSSTILDFGNASQNGAPTPSVEDKFKTVEQFIDDLCSEGHHSSDALVVDHGCDSRVDIAGAHITQDVEANVAIDQLGQVQDVISGIAHEDLSKNAETHTGQKLIPSESATQDESHTLKDVTNKTTRTSLFSDDEFTVLSALPKSGIQGLPKTGRAIILDSDAESDHDVGGVKFHSRKETPSMSTIGTPKFDEVCKSESFRKAEAASHVKNPIKATHASSLSSVSDDSDHETCLPLTEPACIDPVSSITPRKVFSEKQTEGLADAGEKKPISNKHKEVSNMKISKISFENDDPVHVIKRKREVNGESASVIDLTGSGSEVVPRKRLRRQSNKVEVPSTASHEFATRRLAQDHKDQAILDSPVISRSNEAGRRRQRREAETSDLSFLCIGRDNAKPEERGTTTNTNRASVNRNRTSSMEDDENRKHQAVHSSRYDRLSLVPTTRNKRAMHSKRSGPTEDENERDKELKTDALEQAHFNDPKAHFAEGDWQDSKNAVTISATNGPGHSEVLGARILAVNETRLETTFEDGFFHERSNESIAQDSCLSTSEHTLIDVAASKSHSVIIDDSPKFTERAVVTDLKQEKPLNTSKPTSTPSVKPALKGWLPAHVNVNTSPRLTPNGFSNKITSPPLSSVTRRVQHSVTFASDSESISPNDFENDFHRMRGRSLPDMSRPDHKRSITTSSLKRRKVNEDNDHFDKHNHFWPQANKDPYVQNIVDVLDKIHTAIVQRVTGKLECIRANVQYGRTMILEEAADNLRDMGAQSADHFNSLVDLENEYGTFGSSLIKGIEDVSRTQSHLQQQLSQIIQRNDRHTLSKKFSNSLFAASFDDLFHDFSCFDQD